MRKGPKWSTSKYYGKSDEEIIKEWADSGKEASTAGTAMHLAIEQFLHGSPEQIDIKMFDTVEWRYFMKFWNDFGDDLEPYRSEWEVYTDFLLPNERRLKLCGSIDMVFRRKSDAKLVIYDWKRSKEIKSENPFQSGLAPVNHLPDSNYWHYTLQLNIYKWILETYYRETVADLYLVIIHPDHPSYRRMRLNILTEEIEDIMECRRKAVEQNKSGVVLPIPEFTESAFSFQF
jgi:ATP-dependent exoDNAse (exonuclease V) beta subunit